MISSVLEQMRQTYTNSLGRPLPTPPTVEPGTAGPRGFPYRCDTCGDVQGVVPAGEPIACWCCGTTDQLVAR